MTWISLLVVLAAPPPPPPSAADLQGLYSRCLQQTAATFDSSRGGFVAKGMPSEAAVELAFLRDSEAQDQGWKARALRTMEYTESLFDSVGGGFVHSMESKDPGETRLEKRTDSNARRLENLMDAWEATGDPQYRKMGARSVDFFERVLLDGRGGFQYGQVGDTELYPAPNGLAIRAYARWAAVTGEKRYLNFAFKSIERVWEQCWDSSGGLLRRGTFGEVLKYPQLEDQVEMGLALLGTYQVAKRSVDLDRAKTLGELLLVRFEDPRGGFRTQSAPNKSGEVKKAARVDFENARAARFLYELAAAVNDDRFRQAANRAWVPFLEDLGKGDLDAPNWALAARASWAPTVLTPPEWPIAERTTAPTFQRSFTIKSARRGKR